MRPAPGSWRGLLVSVRDAAEAVEAVVGGAAIVDVKEPAHGPLGAASATVAAAVAEAVVDAAPWTLACGELAGGDAAAHVAGAIAALSGAAPWPVAAKAGPAGLTVSAWRHRFAAFATALPRDVEPVAVAYADWRAAEAPPPAAIVAAAASLRCRTLLIDTFDKRADGILGPATVAALPGWIAEAHAVGMAVAVAGRLGPADVGRVARLGAEVVAVRSAACRGGRMGRVDRSLVAAAARLVAPMATSRRTGPATLNPASPGSPSRPLAPHS